MRPIRWLTRGVTWASIGIAGSALVLTARHLFSTPQPLESALSGEGRIDRRREGDIYYNVAGREGDAPLVLLHDFYPGASNYEFRRIFPRLAPDFRVYAPDWLGFGMSERPALAYTGEFYASLLTGFLRETVRQRATIMAHGLAANIAVRAASDEPDLFERLVLVAPHVLAGTEPGPTLAQVLARTAQRSSLGLVPYAALSTRPALRWQSRRRAARPGMGAATDDVLDHAYASSHQFGGHHALLALLTGELDLPIQNAFALLEPPVLVIGGDLDEAHPRALLEDLALLNPQAQLITIEGAGDAAFEDEPAAFVERVTTWLRAPRARLAPQVADSSRLTGPEGEHSADGVSAPRAEQLGEQREETARTIGKPSGEVEERAEPAPDQIRRSMDAPDAPVPTTLEAMTAPLDTQAPLEDEGAMEPERGPHPIPAEVRDTAPATATAAEAPDVTILGPADEALSVPPSPGVGEARMPTIPTEPPSPEVAQMADATVETARTLEEAEAGPAQGDAAAPAQKRGPAGQTRRGNGKTDSLETKPRLASGGAATGEPGGVSAAESATSKGRPGGSSKSTRGAQQSATGSSGRKPTQRKGKSEDK